MSMLADSQRSLRSVGVLRTARPLVVFVTKRIDISMSGSVIRGEVVISDTREISEPERVVTLAMGDSPRPPEAEGQLVL
jgi:hypothetical protein